MSTFLVIRSLRLASAQKEPNRIRGADTPVASLPSWPAEPAALDVTFVTSTPGQLRLTRGPYCASLRSGCGLALDACPLPPAGGSGS